MQKILWVSFLICVACYITGPIVDPDLWWHITSGRWILTHGQVPHVDYWNMFGAGKVWRAYSWSNEILYAAADWYAGVYGLLALKYLLAAVIVFSFGYSLSRISGDWFFGALFAAFAAGACVSHFTLRPQSLVWALFIAVLYQAQLIYQEGLSRRRGIFLAILFIIWANTHVTTIIGLAGLFAFTYSAERKRDCAISVAIGFVSTLITPYFGGEWAALFSQASHPFDMKTISEFKPATILQFPTVFLILSCTLFSILAFFRGKLQEPLRLVGLGAASIAGLAVIKFLPLSSIYVIALVAVEWDYARRAAKHIPLLEGFSHLRAILIDKIPPEGFSFVMLCMSAVFVNGVYHGPISNRVIPVAAVDFIQKHNLPHPILNDFGRGGYMMYRFSSLAGEPGPLVPIDGRTNVIPKSVWRKNTAAMFGKENWREYLDLVKPETILWSADGPLVTILKETKEWCRVFQSGDDTEGFSVLVKKEYYQAHATEVPSDNCGDGKPVNPKPQEREE